MELMEESEHIEADDNCSENNETDEEDETDKEDETDEDEEDKEDANTEFDFESRRWYYKVEPLVEHVKGLVEKLVERFGTYFSLDEMMIHFMGRFVPSNLYLMLRMSHLKSTQQNTKILA